MSKTRGRTIAIRPSDGQPARKITKIIGLSGGGFSVLTPYHKAKSGLLMKAPIDPGVIAEPGEHKIPFNECIRFTATERVKLSYHTDGFAQFSAEGCGRIISGRDPNTGEPKGLGLFTHPLTKPIWSGPSVGITLWNLEEFDLLDDNDNALVFGIDDFYYRATTPDEANVWIVSIFAFPVNAIPPVKFSRGIAEVEVALEPLNPPLLSVLRLKLIHLPKERVFLGVQINRCWVDSPKPGWVLSGPGDFTGTKKGHTLLALYPLDSIGLDGTPLDRPEVTPP